VSANFADEDSGQSSVRESEQLRSVNPNEVLRELCVLLEEYAPSASSR